MTPRKRVLLFATKLGYQTRSFQCCGGEIRRRDRVCDRPLRIDSTTPGTIERWRSISKMPEAAAGTVLEAQRGVAVDGMLALGDRPTITAAYVARGLGLPHNHPASVEACRSKLRMREVLRDAGVPVPWFRSVNSGAHAGAIAARKLRTPAC